jgi:predicted transcriptional regulator
MSKHERAYDDDTNMRGRTDLTVGIVAAYVSNNHVQANELPALIAGVYASLCNLNQPAAPAEVEVEKPTPAQIRRSITHEALVSFIDGKAYKTLKRHLTKHGLDLRAYKERYGLPADYPSTAPAYSEARSALARNLGLGRKAAIEPEPEPEPVVEEAPKPRGRRRKAAA